MVCHLRIKPIQNIHRLKTENRTPENGNRKKGGNGIRLEGRKRAKQQTVVSGIHAIPTLQSDTIKSPLGDLGVKEGAVN